jgi:hypothetical protein
MFMQSTKQDYIHNDNNSKNAVTMILLSLILIATALIGHEELGKAQSDSMDPITMHIHPHLSILVNGTLYSVPAQIGIVPSLWKDHSLDNYGMQSMPEMKMSAMTPLHTHDNSGIVHVESTVNRNYALGEFLNIWGLHLDGKTVKMTVDGKPLPDFRNHILRDGEQIRLEVQ